MEFEFKPHSAFSQGSNYYRFELTPTVEEAFLVSEERKYITTNWRSYCSPSQESSLYEKREETSATGTGHGVGYFVYQSIANWMVYHFHDTSSSAPMRRYEIIEDNTKLRSNGGNVAPFLLKLKTGYHSYYQDIINAVRLVMPFFDDFRLDVQKKGEAEKVKLDWQQKGSDFLTFPTARFVSSASLRPC